MATLGNLDAKVQSLIEKSYPQAKDAGEDGVKVSSAAFPNVEYTTSDKAEIEQWLITSSHIASTTEDTAKTSDRLSSLNTHLSTRTTLLGSKPSIADVALYARLAPVISSWAPEQRTGAQGYHHIVRHVDFVQNAPMFRLQVEQTDKVSIDVDNIIAKIQPIDAKAEKERKKKEKELAAAAGAEGAAASGATVTSAASADTQSKGATKQQQEQQQQGKENKSTGDKIASAIGAEVPGVKKEKKEKAAKQPKAAKAAAPEKPLSPALIDLRVGHILKAIAHPNADSLYVSTIAVGDPAGTENTTEYQGQVCRTVCSGLNGLIPLQDMQNRKIVAVCNLKPVTMRGIKSAAMVLAASPRLAEGDEDNHAGPVELVELPAAAQAGDRVYFEGWEGDPEPVLNPKKKVWETCQVGFTTTQDLGVAFDAGAVEALKASGGKMGLALLKTKSGPCTVQTLKGAVVR